MRRIRNIGQRVYHLSFSADGKTLAVACGEPGKSGEVRLVDFDTGEVVGVVARSSDVALDVAFRPGSNTLAVASADSLIRLVDTRDCNRRSYHRQPCRLRDRDCVERGRQPSGFGQSRQVGQSLRRIDRRTPIKLPGSRGGSPRRGDPRRGQTGRVRRARDGKLHRWNIDDAKRSLKSELAKRATNWFATETTSSCHVPITECCESI